MESNGFMNIFTNSKPELSNKETDDTKKCVGNVPLFYNMYFSSIF